MDIFNGKVCRTRILEAGNISGIHKKGIVHFVTSRSQTMAREDLESLLLPKVICDVFSTLKVYEERRICYELHKEKILQTLTNLHDLPSPQLATNISDISHAQC
jgi:hypothetical protein